MSGETPAAWHEAGLLRPNGGEGEDTLDRPVGAGAFRAPAAVDLMDDGTLVWRHAGAVRDVRPGPGMLEGFVRLGQVPAEEILSYAWRWGVLELCEHDLPYSHNPARRCGVRHLEGAEGIAWEPVAAWRVLARQARAILNLAARLHEGADPARVGDPEDWRTLPARGMGAFGLFYGVSAGPSRDCLAAFGDIPQWGEVGFQRRVLARVLNEWLTMGQVRLSFQWAEGGPMVVLDGSGLFGALAAQLALAVGRTEGLALCMGCGMPYVPRRRPARGRRNYCEACGARAAWRDSARERRRRKSEDAKGGIE